MNKKTFTKATAIIASAFLAATLAASGSATAATSASITKDTSNAVPGETAVTETLSLSNVDTTQAIACVKGTWSLAANGTGSIPGFVAGSGATLSGFSPSGASTAYNASGFTTTFTATNPPAAFSVAATGITNGTTPNTTYFTTFTTFSDTGCTTAVNTAVAGFVYTPSTVVSVDVEPTMTFTVAPRPTYCGLQTTPGGSFQYTTPADAAHVNLGRINISTVGQGAHNLTVATNAARGAAVYVRGDHASNNLRSPTATPFPDTNGPPIAGTSNFTYTVSNIHNGLNTTWKALSATNTEAAWSSSLGFVDQCIGFSAAASASVPAGTYQATVYYTAVPSF